MTTDLRALCAKLIERLEWYVQEDDTFEGDNTEDGGINWDEENAYWINGRDEAIALITRARATLAEPEGEEPTGDELLKTYCDARRAFYFEAAEGESDQEDRKAATIAGLQATLARWCRPTAPPATGPGEVEEPLKEHPDFIVAPVSDSKMAAYNHRAAARFAILDRLEKVINFNSFGWRLTPEGEQWQQIMAEQGQDECEMGL